LNPDPNWLIIKQSAARVILPIVIFLFMEVCRNDEKKNVGSIVDVPDFTITFTSELYVY
jgi:hypothetical protein